MISKELLSTVYPIDETTETYVGIQESTGRVMWFGKEYNDCRSEIDIHRVAHKCKEWLYDNFYKLPRASECGSWHRMYFEKDNDAWFINIEWSDEQIYYSFRGETEPEAIFKACEWILTKDIK